MAHWANLPIDPLLAWRVLEPHLVRAPAMGLAVSAATPKPPGHVRIVCVSDTHNNHDSVQIPPADILVHAGDFTSTGKDYEIHAFCDWIEQQAHIPHKVVIAGNHDLSLDAESYPHTYRRFGHREQYPTAPLIERLKKCCHYLHDESVTVCGLKFYGTPYQPWFHDWAFNLDRGEQCRAKWAQIEADSDVVVVHGPPLGHGDICDGTGHQGCTDLLRWMETHAPPLLICGHIHEDYGVTTNGRTVVANPSTMNLQYDPRRPNPPILFDVPLDPEARAAWRRAVAVAGGLDPDHTTVTPVAPVPAE